MVFHSEFQIGKLLQSDQQLFEDYLIEVIRPIRFGMNCLKP